MAERNDLESKLKAIKDLKSEHYIGTKEAWDYLNAVERVYSAPKEVADMINQRVKEAFHLTYEATPEIFFGLQNLLARVTMDVDLMHQDYEEKRNENVYSEDLEELSDFFRIFNVDFQIFPNKNGASNQDFVDMYSRFFENANADLVRSDTEFGKRVIKTIIDEYNRARNSLSPERRDLFFEYFIDLEIELDGADWETIFSKERLREIEREQRKTALSEISTSNIVGRILRDRVDNRIEHRRAVLCKWLSDAGFKTYEQAVEGADKRIEMRENRLELFLFNGAEKGNIDEERRLIAEAKFIRGVLNNERNFVVNYLKH